MHRTTKMVAALVLACAAFVSGVGCGGDDSQQQQQPGDGGPRPDAGIDANGSLDGSVPKDSGLDSSPSVDSGADANADAGLDAQPDTGTVDAGDGGGKDGGALLDHGGSAIVSGGAVSHSANYTLIGTLGQSPGGNDTASSPNFKLHGGVVGATQAP